MCDDEDEGDENDPLDVDVRRRLATLTALAKKHKSATTLFKLHTLQMYLDLHAQFSRNLHITKPAQRASLSIARLVGRGPYFVRQLRHLKLYIHCFGTLPPNQTGKHHTHPSLLDNEEILAAVRRYLTVLADGEVRITKFCHAYICSETRGRSLV